VSCNESEQEGRTYLPVRVPGRRHQCYEAAGRSDESFQGVMNLHERGEAHLDAFAAQRSTGLGWRSPHTERELLAGHCRHSRRRWSRGAVSRTACTVQPSRWRRRNKLGVKLGAANAPRAAATDWARSSAQRSAASRSRHEGAAQRSTKLGWRMIPVTASIRSRSRTSRCGDGLTAE
jgi:hypothetical protein